MNATPRVFVGLIPSATRPKAMGSYLTRTIHSTKGFVVTVGTTRPIIAVPKDIVQVVIVLNVQMAKLVTRS
jgi:hypothetical protein